jgi:hypothetical protein
MGVKMRALSFMALLCAVSAQACTQEAQVMVRFQGEPGGALVYIEDRYIGRLEQLAARGIKMPAGEYRVTVEEVGYFPHDELVVVRPGRAPKVKIRLTPIPD